MDSCCCVLYKLNGNHKENTYRWHTKIIIKIDSCCYNMFYVSHMVTTKKISIDDTQKRKKLEHITTKKSTNHKER